MKNETVKNGGEKGGKAAATVEPVKKEVGKKEEEKPKKAVEAVKEPVRKGEADVMKAAAP